jgi:cyclin-dependent kinase 8/11
MVFAYAEHDFLQLIHHHSQTIRQPMSLGLLKSLTYQLLNGLVYLHSCHVLHRDLKPANILITTQGVVKIGDLGLARIVYAPLQPLHIGDKVVVTIWYRAPELLMGAKHYNKAIDVWATGCVLAELAALRPIFKGEEAKLDSKKNVPFQRDQLIKILDVLGTPTERDWPGIVDMPEYHNMKKLDSFHCKLEEWAQGTLRDWKAYDLLRKMFTFDPTQRVTASQALQHQWFSQAPLPSMNAFEGLSQHQLPPQRKITQDEGSGSGMMGGLAQSQRGQVRRLVFCQPQYAHALVCSTGTVVNSLKGASKATDHGLKRAVLVRVAMGI